MKIIGKVIIPLFIVAVFLISCNNSASPTSINTTDVAGTAMAIVKTTIVETQDAIPTITFTPQLPTLISQTSLPPTEIHPPVKTSLPISGTPTTIGLENGLIWSECIVPYFNHPHETADLKFATSCLNMEWLGWDDYDVELNGQRLREERISGDGENNGSNLRLIIGKDIYETHYINTNEWNDYELLKNGESIAKARAYSYRVTGERNLKLWNIGGKSVWEIYSEPPAIFVDGINLNEKNNLEGSYKPYDIKHKLIYIAKMNGKYYVIYDEKIIGYEFDQIFMTYCCASTSVLYGHEQYWFWGIREGTYYVVAIN